MILYAIARHRGGVIEYYTVLPDKTETWQPDDKIAWYADEEGAEEMIEAQGFADAFVRPIES